MRNLLCLAQSVKLPVLPPSFLICFFYVSSNEFLNQTKVYHIRVEYQIKDNALNDLCGKTLLFCHKNALWMNMFLRAILTATIKRMRF